MRRVVLASASPRRRELLAALVPDFDVDVSDALEEPVPDDPVGGAVRLALRKARVVAARQPGAVVIGADTGVHDGQRDYGKPDDAAHARAMLKALCGREHTVVTALAVVADDRESTAASVSRVTLANISDAAIDAYVASGRPLDKAGAYGIQDADLRTASRLEGCYCAVMGLPLWQLRELVAATGVAAGDPSRCVERCASCPERK